MKQRTQDVTLSLRLEKIQENSKESDLVLGKLEREESARVKKLIGKRKERNWVWKYSRKEKMKEREGECWEYEKFRKLS